MATPKSKAMWRSTERIYTNAEGVIVDRKDPSRATLLVAAGGSLPLADAQALGLVEEAAVENVVAVDARLGDGEDDVHTGVATQKKPAGKPAAKK